MRAAARASPARRCVRILDAGCGPATTLALATLAPTVGVDVHPAPSHSRAGEHRPAGARERVRASFSDASFDAVVSVDVLYTGRSGTTRGARRLARCAPAARVLWLPAYTDASSHDAVEHTARRYTKQRLRELAQRCDLAVERLTYIFAPVLIASLLYGGSSGCAAARALLAHAGAAPVERDAAGVLAVESELARAYPPFGLSVLAAAPLTTRSRPARAAPRSRRAER